MIASIPSRDYFSEVHLLSKITEYENWLDKTNLILNKIAKLKEFLTRTINTDKIIKLT